MVRVSAFVLVTALAACGGGAPPPSATPSDTPDTAARPAETTSPEDTPGGPAKEIDCGDFTTCAIATDGIARCWGRNKGGELGDGSGNGQRLKRGAIPGLGKVKKIALASQFGCAIVDDGKVKCWGTGRIANNGKSFTSSKAVAVEGVDGAEEIVASGAIACARGASGVACWGSEEKGLSSPPKGAFKQIAAGFAHACAIDSAGAVACWGPADWGASGQFAKPGITGARQVVTGDRHSCVITKSKGVACWGMNDAGQLGMKPDTDAHKKPVTVAGITDVAKLAAGEASTCALMTDSSVRCWGSNGEGELGLGTRSPDERPSRVTALTEIDQICLASAHGCALTKSSHLLCWGGNSYGQLGDGTRERRPSPTPVSW